MGGGMKTDEELREMGLAYEREYEETGTNAATPFPPGTTIQEAFAEMKKRMISMRVEPGVIARLKIKAKRVGIPYQTLAASVLKRYVDGNLDIEAA